MPRSVNDLVTPLQILNGLAAIMPLNTAFAAASGTVLINTLAPLISKGGPFPALQFEQMDLSTDRLTYQVWQKHLKVKVSYYNRWDQQTATIDAIWAAMDADLQAMAANLEDKPRITIGGTSYSVKSGHVVLSPFVGEEISGKIIPGSVLMRWLTVDIDLPPYLSAT